MGCNESAYSSAVGVAMFVVLMNEPCDEEDELELSSLLLVLVDAVVLLDMLLLNDMRKGPGEGVLSSLAVGVASSSFAACACA